MGHLASAPVPGCVHLSRVRRGADRPQGDGGRKTYHAAAAMNTYAIEVQGLVKRYGDLEAVRGIDLAVHQGEIFGFLGPNGAGKSTTISVLSTLLKPTAGTASVAGLNVVEDPG